MPTTATIPTNAATKRTHAPAWSRLDTALIGIVAAFGILTLLSLAIAPHLILPEEDAVILFQYAHNLAHFGAITYIPHGPHAEGATDFLWMLLLAGGIKLHLDPFWFVALLNVASLIALPFLLTRIAGRRLTPLAALFIIGAFGLMPQASAAALGFSVLPFACLIALTTLFFLQRNDIALGLTSLTLCLFRPDGLVFALPLLASAILLYNDRLRRAAIFNATFVIPGIVYFLWRWHYFNELLPLPFLVKSDTPRFARLIVLSSLQHGALLCLFTFALAALAIYKQPLRYSTKAVLVSLLLLPNLFYFAMRLDQNAGHRFFLYLPLGAAIVIAIQWDTLDNHRTLLRCGLALWLLLVCRISVNAAHAGWDAQFDNRVAIAHDLSLLPHGTLLVTEAGFLPYGSGWPTSDAWGLNTPRFASHLLQPADVTDLNPDAILVYTGNDNECTASTTWSTPYTTRTWHHMTRNLITGAGANYNLWYAPYASSKRRAEQSIQPWQSDQECWLLRTNSPLRPELESVLSHHGGEPAAQHNSHFTAEATPAPTPPQTTSLLRILARTPYRWWIQLSE